MTTALIPGREHTNWQHEFEEAKYALQKAEAQLTEEQAAINRFRMHCRLKLDHYIDQLMELRAEKQALLTRLQLHQQGDAHILNDPDPLGQVPPLDEDEPDPFDDLLLPTDTPNDKAAEKRLYRELARRFHPDLASTTVERAYRTSMMAAVNNAYQASDTQALYDLAGELDPTQLAELATITTPKTRKLRQHILNCQRRQRKIRRQLHTLRQENTARLYYKAQQLEQNGDTWWITVRQEINQAINQLQQTVNTLTAQLAQLESPNP